MQIPHQFRVNACGPLNAVTALRSWLQQNTKVLIVTSRMASLTNTTTMGGMVCMMTVVHVVREQTTQHYTLGTTVWIPYEQGGCQYGGT